MSHNHLPLAEKILREALGEVASFRDGQWESISAIVESGKRLIVVQRTGWGKSLVYFVATRLNRNYGRGMTILISPLLSLMRNQITQAEKYGLRAEHLDSTNTDEHGDIEVKILNYQIDILFISPERLGNNKFRERIWSKIHHSIGLLVVDEVHCISDWGHDFRPDYRRIMRILSEIPAITPIVGTTATANTRVINDVKEILGGDVEVSRGSLMRESLHLYTFPEPMDTANRLVLTSHLLRSISGTGIIYCTTIKDCELVASWLRQEGFEAEAYHSKLENREELEQKLLDNKLKALVASVALGMGFDKPDLKFVIHFQLPGSIIGYYQQIGRAGRGIDEAHIILMHGPGDREIQEYFIETAFPNIDVIQDIAQVFLKREILSNHDLQVKFNLRKTQADKIIQQLEIEGYIAYGLEGYEHTGQPLPDFAHWQDVTQKRYQELEHMETFVHSESCLMRFLADALEDTTHPDDCGKCKNCKSQQSRFSMTEEQYAKAQLFLLEGEPIWIDPRKQWTSKGVIEDRFKLEHLNETGLALSYYNDDGWGKYVKQGKYIHNHFDDRLVEASANLIMSHWGGQLSWVTNIPSTRHPHLVQNFAHRLAGALGLPYVDAVHCIREYPEQKTMQNTYLQLQNIASAFEIRQDIPQESVLLVDDIVDSGWSLTLSGWLLRENGVNKVYPFVLAKATGNL